MKYCRNIIADSLKRIMRSPRLLASSPPRLLASSPPRLLASSPPRLPPLPPLPQLPNPDTPERHLIAMVLQRDVAPGRPAVPGPLLELAGPHPGFPVGAHQFVFHDLDIVEPVLNVMPPHHQADLVPFPCRFHHPRWSGIQPVGRPGRGQAVLAVRVSGSVQDLHLRTAVVALRAGLGDPVEDPAVPARGNLPLEGQLEITVLFLGDDVSARRDPCQRPIDGLPPRRNGLLLVSPPPTGGVPVEQQLQPAFAASGVRVFGVLGCCPATPPGKSCRVRPSSTADIRMGESLRQAGRFRG